MELQVVLSEDLSDAPPFILSRAVISDRGFWSFLLKDAKQTPLCTELQMYRWHWAIAKQSAWKEVVLGLLPLARSVAVDRASACSGTEGMKKGAGRDAMQRASVEGGGSRGSLSFARLF